MDYYELSISTDFSRTPGPRFIDEGDYSGEDFRNNKLVPILKKAIEEGKGLRVNLDGTAGYATSFLEESFGGLIRENGMSRDEIKKALLIISEEEEFLIENIYEYIDEAHDEKFKN
jgi:hypothetical protein